MNNIKENLYHHAREIQSKAIELYHKGSKTSVEWKGHIIKTLKYVCERMHEDRNTSIAVFTSVNIIFFTLLNATANYAEKCINRNDPIPSSAKRFFTHIVVNVAFTGSFMFGFNFFFSRFTQYGLKREVFAVIVATSIVARIIISAVRMNKAVSEHKKREKIDLDAAQDLARKAAEEEIAKTAKDAADKAAIEAAKAEAEKVAAEKAEAAKLAAEKAEAEAAKLAAKKAAEKAAKVAAKRAAEAEKAAKKAAEDAAKQAAKDEAITAAKGVLGNLVKQGSLKNNPVYNAMVNKHNKVDDGGEESDNEGWDE